MISSLIDTALLTAFAFTIWRTGRTYIELRHLRTATSGLQSALAASDAALTRAAHAVVMLRSDGVDTLNALEASMRQARDLTCQIEGAAVAADLDQALSLAFEDDTLKNLADLDGLAANDRASIEDTAASTIDPPKPSDHWFARLESRFTSASSVNR